MNAIIQYYDEHGKLLIGPEVHKFLMPGHMGDLILYVGT